MASKNPTANRQQAYSGATESLTHLQYSIRMYEGVYLHLDDLFTFHIWTAASVIERLEVFEPQHKRLLQD